MKHYLDLNLHDMRNTRAIIPLIFCCFLAALPLTSKSQNVILRTQTDVDSFDNGIKHILGNLEIRTAGGSMDPIIDLSNLSNIVSIQNNLIITSNPELVNIVGFDSLSTIGMSLSITSNNQLIEIDGFTMLELIGSDLKISHNPDLTYLNGLPKLDTIGKDMILSNNPELLAMADLFNLNHIGNDLLLEYNKKLVDIDGLMNLVSIGNNLSMRNQNMLNNVRGLSNLTFIGSNLTIYRNDNLHYIDSLPLLNSIGGSMIIEENNTLLAIDGFSELVGIENNLSIISNNELQNLDGLRNIETIGGDLTIERNPSLGQIDGLSNLIQIGSSLSISRNDMLVNIDGFRRIESINANLTIGENSSLLDLSGLEQIKSIGRSLKLFGNGPGTIAPGFSILNTIGYNLEITNTNIKNLDEFGNLKSIGNNLQVVNNDSLIRFGGFHSIDSIGNSITIEANSNLRIIEGFENIQHLRKSMHVTNNDALDSITGFHNLTLIRNELEITDNSSLIDLVGFANLDSVMTLDIRHNASLLDLNDFSGLSRAMNLIIWFNKSLIQIDGLFNVQTVNFLSISGNSHLANLSGLQNIHTITQSLEISGNDALVNLNELSQLKSIGHEIHIINCKSLQNVDSLNNLTNFGVYARILRNPKLTHINGFNKVKTVGILEIQDNDELFQIGGFRELLNATDRINIASNNRLHRISGFTKLNTISGTFWINNNPNLSICCGIQHLIPDNNSSLAIFQNAEGCNNEDQIEHYFCSDYYLLHGQISYDLDNNGCDSTDLLFPEITFNRNSNDDVNRIFIGQYARYSVRLLDGNHVLVPVLEQDYLSVSPDTLFINLPSDSLVLNQDFCITAHQQFQDLSIEIIPLNSARPGFEAEYSIICKNNGTMTQNGEISLNFPPQLVQFIQSDTPIVYSSSGELRWEYKDFLPFEKRDIRLTMSLNSPMDDPPLNAGEYLEYVAHITPTHEDIDTVNNTSVLRQQAVNSYDPNSKISILGEVLDSEMVGNYVPYLILFENLGTASAIHVKVVDTIDTNVFDIHSLTVIDASHSYNATISSNVITFEFEFINLPFDDDKNDGYVLFKVKTHGDLVIGTELRNFADIYFDFNLPIRTNTAITTVDESSTTNDLRYSENDILVFPNPAANEIIIASDVQFEEVEIFDSKGFTIARDTFIRDSYYTKIDISSLKVGLYLMNLIDAQGLKRSVKFVKR